MLFVLTEPELIQHYMEYKLEKHSD
jgi:hypothetical protein